MAVGVGVGFGVVGTTGFDSSHYETLKACAVTSPVLIASNFSLGINLLDCLLFQVAKTLPPGFQIEIVEEHHKGKLDAPSGTAEMLAHTACLARSLNPETCIQRGRAGRSETPREDEVVGIHAVRGGTITGTHTVIFAGPQEVIRFIHEAQSPEIFARGALRAVKWITLMPAGWYTMENVLLG